MHQRLQNRLEMPRRQLVPVRQGFGGYRSALGMQCDIDHRGNREDTLPGK
jgi:hypothetical protein